MLTPLPDSLPFRHPAAWIATWFGSGLLPGIPGTWGSLAALPFGVALLIYGGPWILLAAAIALFPIGWWAAEIYVRADGDDDPGPVVVDEVVGQWLALLAVPATALHWIVAAFVLFRVFDILKPPPVGTAERGFKGGLGVMADDVLAGLYALFSLYLIRYIMGL